MLDMTTSLDISRRVLVPVASSQASGDAPAVTVRRYHLARLPLHTRPDPAKDRYAHLRRTHD
jgi:hypothetical protein